MAHSKYIRAERALNAVATLSCKKINVRCDDAMSRTTSAKSILRIEGFLSRTAIASWIAKQQNRSMLKLNLF